MADPRDRASALADPLANADLGESTQKKIAWRLLPLFTLGFGVALMDRNNVGFAALQMNRDLHFSASIYGFGAGLFSIGYALFEIPSNLVLYRFGARRWIARILLTWGLIAMGMMFVRTPSQLYAFPESYFDQKRTRRFPAGDACLALMGSQDFKSRTGCAEENSR